MAMVTWDIDLDLDDSGSFATAIETYVVRDKGVTISGIGSPGPFQDAAISSLTLTLDNSDGRFSPGNTTGPYTTTFRPYKRIRVKSTYNAVTTTRFEGIITEISVRPKTDEQVVYLQAMDYAYALSRSEISIGMSDVLTGVIVDRIIDKAEHGEVVANPFFSGSLGTTDWFDVASGTKVLDPTIPFEGYEGPLKVTATGLGDGVEYHFPTHGSATLPVPDGGHLTAQNDIVRIVIYLRAATTADIGSDVTFQLLGGSALITHTLTGDWVRVSVSGTLTVAEPTTYGFRVTKAAAGAGAWLIGAIHTTLTANSIARATDDGEARLVNVAMNRVSALEAINTIRDQEVIGGQFFFDGATATFYDKEHRWTTAAGTTSQSTIDEDFDSLTHSMNAEDRIAQVVLDFPVYETGEEQIVVWSLFPVPRRIDPSATLRLEVDFGGGLLRNLIVPVAGTDFVILNEDNVDVSGSATVTLDAYGGGATIKITNASSTDTWWLQSLQLRGTPIRRGTDRTPVRVYATTAPSFASILTHSYRFNDAKVMMDSAAEYLISRYGETQQDGVSSLTLTAPHPEAPTTGQMPDILNRKIGDRITLTNNNLPWSSSINSDYYIDGMDIRLDNDSISGVWAISPVDNDYFQLDVDILDSGPGLAP